MAYAECMANSGSFQPQHPDEVVERMRLAVAQTTEGDRELLKELVRCALAASASVDPFDYDTLVTYSAYRSDLHCFFLTVYALVKGALNKQFKREHIEELEPIDDDDFPF